MRRSCDPPRIKSDVPIGTPTRGCGHLPDSPGINLRAIFSLTLLLLTGCYTYAESSLASLTPGLQARVILTEDGFGRVVNQAAVEGVPIDMFDTSERGVAGLVRELGPSNMKFEMRGLGGSVFAADVPIQSVQEVSVRTFSRNRTIGAAAAVAVLFAGVYTGVAGGTVSGGQPPEPENMVLPSNGGIGSASSLPSSWRRFDAFLVRLRFGR